MKVWARSILKIHGLLKQIIRLLLREMVIMEFGNWQIREESMSSSCTGKTMKVLLSSSSITLMHRDSMKTMFQILTVSMEVGSS